MSGSLAECRAAGWLVTLMPYPPPPLPARCMQALNTLPRDLQCTHPLHTSPQACNAPTCFTSSRARYTPMKRVPPAGERVPWGCFQVRGEGGTGERGCKRGSRRGGQQGPALRHGVWGIQLKQTISAPMRLRLWLLWLWWLWRGALELCYCRGRCGAVHSLARLATAENARQRSPPHPRRGNSQLNPYVYICPRSLPPSAIC